MSDAPAHPAVPAHPAPSVFARLCLALADIKLAHSVFALPFAVLAAVLVAPDRRRLPAQLALVVLCMVAARTWAMLVNRLADRSFDAANPRTARRAFARGDLSARDGLLLLAAAAAAFVAGASLFGVLFANWLPALLAAPVLAWIALYSFTKRFTWLCHLFLGGALAASPLAAAVALDPASLAHTPALFFLAGMVLLWVAGFDVIYALQDLDFDRRAQLSSIPARFGWRGAAWISRALHVAALACLVAAWQAEPRLSTFFPFAIAAVAVCLLAEHAVLARRGAAGIPMAFFTINGLVSLLLGAAGVADLLLAPAANC
jgi:4-hydroxybenzoate polyprenyltransferase